jgi:5-methylcytosine-specific restriction protein B
MARFKGQNTDAIYGAAEQWRDKCLLKPGSLLWDTEEVWTTENLLGFKKQFIDQPDEATDKDFGTKFQEQLKDGPAGVYRLATELLFVHFLFTTSMRGDTKKWWIHEVVKWGELSLDDPLPILDALDGGIGGPGESYNIRRWKELAAIDLFALDIVSKEPEERTELLSDHEQVRDVFVRNELDASQSSHVLLHLLFPEKYERIASMNHKSAIVTAFGSLLDDCDAEQIDDRLFVIRSKLEEIMKVEGGSLDFYWDSLSQVWRAPTSAAQDFDPTSGLRNKKQIAFYGPPGTGKTYQANQIAHAVIRQDVLNRWGFAKLYANREDADRICEERIRRVQFHPGYGYEEFVRGLQLGENGKTEYRNGVLLDIIEKMGKDDQEQEGMPFVLILDEMNRADLSRVLGECFSLLENRGQPTTLAGHDGRSITLPENLYITGTMNLIDQSLEQVDFALRRRFLWFPRDYSQEEFMEISRYRWERILKDGEVKEKWSFDSLIEEFELLAERASAVNVMISGFHSLGDQYKIGHTYFADIVDFLKNTVRNRKQMGRVLFNNSGKWKEPVQQLWLHSLKPLLEQYLSGIESSERLGFLNSVESVLTTGQEK